MIKRGRCGHLPPTNYRAGNNSYSGCGDRVYLNRHVSAVIRSDWAIGSIINNYLAILFGSTNQMTIPLNLKHRQLYSSMSHATKFLPSQNALFEIWQLLRIPDIAIAGI